MSKIKRAVGGLDSWLGKSIARDREGKPLLTYRGEHGEPGREMFQSRLPSLTFSDDAEAASLYAIEPNNNAERALAPRVTPSYLKIERPILDAEDPFMDMKDVSERLDPALAEMLARRHSRHITGTGNWDENFSDRFDDIDELLRADPKLLNELYMDAYPLLDDPDFVRAAKGKGYDGARHIGNGETGDSYEYRIFDPSQARSPFMKKARGGLADYTRDTREKARADYSEEMDHRDRFILDDYGNIVATKQPLGDMAPPRLPKVRHFEEGGGTSDWNGASSDPADFAGPEYAASSSPSYSSSNYDRSYSSPASTGQRDSNIPDASGVYGGNAGTTSYGGGGYDYGRDGGFGANAFSGNSGVGMGAEDGGSLGPQNWGGWQPQSYYNVDDDYNYGMYTPAAPAPVTGGMLPGPMPEMSQPVTSYELPGPMPEMPEPGFTGVGADIMTQAGIGPTPGYNASQPLGGLGLDMFSPTPVANQDVDLAAATPDRQSWDPFTSGPTSTFNNPFTETLRDLAASSNITPLGSPDDFEDAPDRGFHGTRSVNTPAADPFGTFTPDTFTDRSFRSQPQNNAFEAWSPDVPEDTGGSFGVRNNERGVMGPTMSKAAAREQFTYEYTRDQLRQAGYNPTPEFMAAVTGNFRKEAPNLLAGRTPDEINHIGAQGLMQTLGTRQDRLQEFRAAQDPNFGNLRKDLDFFVDNVRSPVIGDDFNTRKDYSRFVDAIDSPNIDDGVRAMNAYERPGGYAGYNTPLNNLDQGRATGTYARDYDRRFGDLDAPSVTTSVPGTQPRAEWNAGSILNELFGMGTAQAATPGAPAAPVDPSSIPELDPWASERSIVSGIGNTLGDFGRSVSGGIRSFTGTADDGTQPTPSSSSPSFGFTPDLFRQDTMIENGLGRSFGNAMVAGVNTRGLNAGYPTTDSPYEDSSMGSTVASRTAAAGAPASTTVPELPPATSVASVPQPPEERFANVPMPPERPWAEYQPPTQTAAVPEPPATPAAAAASRERAAATEPVAVATAQGTNRFNVDPLTRNVYDAATGNRVIDPGIISKVIDLVVGVTPAGPFNSLGALAGSATGYPLSVGQLMATGSPGQPLANAGSGDAPDANGNYGSYGEGNAGRDPPGVQGAAGDPYAGIPTTPTPAPQVAASTPSVSDSFYADWLRRNYNGVDDPRTYGMRPQQRMFSARGGLASIKG